MNDGSIFYIVPLVMFLVMIATKLYETSLSTAISVCALLVSSYLYTAHIVSVNTAFLIMSGGIFLVEIRAIINRNQDKWVKR